MRFEEIYPSDKVCGSCFIPGLDKSVVKVSFLRWLKFEYVLCIRGYWGIIANFVRWDNGIIVSI